jgi:CubicO group peptidase (beta-lactamase class C family)
VGDNFSGAILIADGQKIVNSTGYGFASCDNSVANQPDTVFAIGSITKMFTAAAVGQLDEAGKLDIEATISNYFADAPPDKANITIRQLLDHTAGLRPYHETEGKGDFESMNQEKALSEILKRPLLIAPGQGEEYSNSGYTLLALLIEQTSGQPYTEYIRENILIPAGMTSTGFWGENFEKIASTQNRVLGCSSPDSWEYSWVLIGNGGMLSTVGDLHRWVLVLKGDDVLNQSAKKRLGFDQILTIGFGDAGGSSQHDFNASLTYLAPTDAIVVAISNRPDLRAEDITDQLLMAALHETKLPHR